MCICWVCYRSTWYTLQPPIEYFSSDQLVFDAHIMSQMRDENKNVSKLTWTDPTLAEAFRAAA